MSETMNMTRFAVCALLLTGCGGAMGAPFQPAHVSPGKSVIYVYRPNRFIGSKVSMMLTVDGNVVGMLDNGSYIPYHVKPGKHTLQIGSHYHRITVTTEAGKVQYLRDDLSFAGGWNLVPVASSEASAEIRDCVLLPGTDDGTRDVTRLDLTHLNDVVVGVEEAKVRAWFGKPDSSTNVPAKMAPCTHFWTYQAVKVDGGKVSLQFLTVDFDAQGKVCQKPSYSCSGPECPK